MHINPPSCQQVPVDQVLANLLCLLHLYFIGEHCAPCEARLSQAICAHLQRLGETTELGRLTRETCLELIDHWGQRMAGSGQAPGFVATTGHNNGRPH